LIAEQECLRFWGINSLIINLWNPENKEGRNGVKRIERKSKEFGHKTQDRDEEGRSHSLNSDYRR